MSERVCPMCGGAVVGKATKQFCGTKCTKRESARRLRAANPDKIREKARESCRRWRAAHPDKARDGRESRRRRLAEDPEKARKTREKDCERARRWAAANPEKARKTKRRWDEANREKRRERHRRDRAANLEQYRKNGREARRRQRAANPEKCRDDNRRWRAANPEKAKEHSHLNYAKRQKKRRDFAKHNGWPEWCSPACVLVLNSLSLIGIPVSTITVVQSIACDDLTRKSCAAILGKLVNGGLVSHVSGLYLLSPNSLDILKERAKWENEASQ